MSETANRPRPGSLRSFAGGVVSLLLTRAELLSLEAQELKDDIVGNLFIGMLALVLLGVGLIAGVLLLWVLTPPAWKAWIMGALAAVLLGSALALLWNLRQRLRRQPQPFAVTLQETRKDWAALGLGERP
ncbi:hypothetical protein CEK28_11835 [Xenophilus sp. AP218F]|nr:phage holin family protein [Chromobacterium sp. ASV5]OWY38773.1 hypothetical protein CEK28_11835 [Xenophilus sp. AP218F]